MNKSVLKICSLVFGVVSLAALVVLLCFSVSFPYTETYRVWGSVYTQHYSGYFDTSNLSSMILLFFGAFWGIVLFFALPCGKCAEKKNAPECETKDEVEKSVESSSCGCCSENAAEAPENK